MYIDRAVDNRRNKNRYAFVVFDKKQDAFAGSKLQSGTIPAKPIPYRFSPCTEKISARELLFHKIKMSVFRADQ